MHSGSSFKALASTSSGFAWSHGHGDGRMSRDRVVELWNEPDLRDRRERRLGLSSRRGDFIERRPVRGERREIDPSVDETHALRIDNSGRGRGDTKCARSDRPDLPPTLVHAGADQHDDGAEREGREPADRGFELGGVVGSEDRDDHDDEGEDEPFYSGNTWVVLARSPQFFDSSSFKSSSKPLKPKPGFRAWTDDFSNLIQILK